jgi:hypothetical protein
VLAFQWLSAPLRRVITAFGSPGRRATPQRLFVLCLLSLLPLTSLRAQQPLDADALAATVADNVLAWRRDIHQHPELGNREVRTARLVADRLRALGMEPVTGIAHAGVTAVLKGGRPGPRIALRADMDALPVTEATGLPFASTVTTQYRGETVGVMRPRRPHRGPDGRGAGAGRGPRAVAGRGAVHLPAGRGRPAGR